MEEASLAGVSALAQEIDERLSAMPRAATEDLRQLRREFSKRLKDAAPYVVIELASLLLEVPGMQYRFIAYELIHHHPGALGASECVAVGTTRSWNGQLERRGLFFCLSCRPGVARKAGARQPDSRLGEIH